MALKNISLSLANTNSSFIQRITFLKEKSTKIFHSIIGLLRDRIKSGNNRLDSSSSNLIGSKKRFSFKNRTKSGKLILIIVVASIVLVGGWRLIAYNFDTPSQNSKVKVKGAKASFEVNKEFVFPLRDGGGEEVSNVKYLIEKAELLDEIIVKGQRAKAVSGRTFLIITLKITNEYKQAIEMESRDYVRLSVNGNKEEWLAPEIHNDPVETRAISTKYTRVGFPINETDKNLILRVGEIDGKKEEIAIEFK